MYNIHPYSTRVYLQLGHQFPGDGASSGTHVNCVIRGALLESSPAVPDRINDSAGIEEILVLFVITVGKDQ
jgi:hypothetical protein